MHIDISLFLIPAGVVACFYIIFIIIEHFKNKRKDMVRYQRTLLYSVLLDMRRLQGADIDDIVGAFRVRNSWYNLRGIPFGDKILLIQAGYSIENAKRVYRTIDTETLKVQSHLFRQ